MDIPILETERLRLRGFRETDIDDFSTLNANPEFVAHIGQGEPISATDSWNVMCWLIGHWHIRGYGFWVIEDKSTGEFLGRAGLWRPHEWPGVEIGWGLTPKVWGRGYATEAAHAILEWGFNHILCDEIISVIHPDNEASKKVARRIGETFKETAVVNGKASEIFAITREDYEGQQADGIDCGRCLTT